MWSDFLSAMQTDKRLISHDKSHVGRRKLDTVSVFSIIFMVSAAFLCEFFACVFENFRTNCKRIRILQFRKLRSKHIQKRSMKAKVFGTFWQKVQRKQNRERNISKKPRTRELYERFIKRKSSFLQKYILSVIVSS